ncbi:YqiA/YcfP family alpha/beta fold hydrolase [Achromobacter sp. F4_2707]|uniref:YqiA/YcfP family alpha/beta fold hydrolase n=1 Tax=Achromobacter sp. F4_2707 TaxID=3114286 RepID=UPI0039C61E48
MILYLHGFRSSPQSTKASMLAQAVREAGRAADWVCPQLPPSPHEALVLCTGLIQQRIAQGMDSKTELVVLGSSLGGYYATCLAEAWQCRALLFNPVVHAARDLATQVGEHTMWNSDERFHFLPSYVDELADMAVPRPAQPERYYLLAAKGDEVLDWREMVEFYQGCELRLLEGSDHGISDFSQWLPEVLERVLRTQ